MPLLIIPDSNCEDATVVREYNKCHAPGGSPVGGQFCGDGAGSPEKYERPKPTRVSDINLALKLIAAGHVVELENVKAVGTLLDKLAAMALDAQAKGEKAGKYDLCKVSVAGTNLFCAARLRTKDNPEGIPRLAMPQFGGHPEPGTEAAKLAKNEHGGVDAGPAFIAYLKSLGIAAKTETVRAATLRASQAELIGTKIASMMKTKRILFHESELGIFVSRDGYVVDGHHRWAARVGLDAEDGHLGDTKINVIRLDAPISELLKLGNAWAPKFGIKPVGT